MTKIAVIQSPPVLLDREKTMARVLALLPEAAREGATLLVFPEAYLPGYPAWVWRLRPEIDVEEARRARRSLDVCGHYARPDIFSRSVDRRPLAPVSFSD